MTGGLDRRLVLVTRETDYEQLLAHHATRGQADVFLRRRAHTLPVSDTLDTLDRQRSTVAAMLTEIRNALPKGWRLAAVRRAELDRFLFGPEDVIVAVGQDGLVANVAKYLTGQPVIGVNADPQRNAGVLVPHAPGAVAGLLARAAAGTLATEPRTMIRAELDDGQHLLALNEIFVGHASHQSARYVLNFAGREEAQSSSGLIVATGTGATGWALSISRATGIAVALSPAEPAAMFLVREPWPSRATGAELVSGRLGPDDKLLVVSRDERGRRGVRRRHGAGPAGLRLGPHAEPVHRRPAHGIRAGPPGRAAATPRPHRAWHRADEHPATPPNRPPCPHPRPATPAPGGAAALAPVVAPPSGRPGDRQRHHPRRAGPGLRRPVHADRPARHHQLTQIFHIQPSPRSIAMSVGTSRFWSRVVHDLAPYVPGEQPRTPNLIKLNTNESPFGPSPHVVAAIQAEAADSLRLYPDPEATALRQALAAYHGVRPDQVFVGNGSDEVLAHAFPALLKHDLPLLMPDITYGFYPAYCRLFGIQAELVPLDSDFRIRIEDYARPCGAIILPNPNAPTGIALSRTDIAALLARAPGPTRRGGRSLCRFRRRIGDPADRRPPQSAGGAGPCRNPALWPACGWATRSATLA